MPAVYRVADVAMMLAISDETVRRGAADGWIPAVRVSASKYVFPRQAEDTLGMALRVADLSTKQSGEGGIRTHGGHAPATVFETVWRRETPPLPAPICTFSRTISARWPDMHAPSTYSRNEFGRKLGRNLPNGSAG